MLFTYLTSLFTMAGIWDSAALAQTFISLFTYYTILLHTLQNNVKFTVSCSVKINNKSGIYK